MKSKLFVIVCLLFPLLYSCDGFQISDNGDLDGMWHLVEVDSVQVNHKSDYTDKGIFWSVQSDLLFLEDKRQQHQPCLMRFNHKDDILIVTDPYIYMNRESEDIPLCDVSLLAPYGINGLEDRFVISKLNKKRMILCSSELVLNFEKY